MPSPKGYTRLQIALHWGVALLIVQQYLFKDAIAAAWDATTKGLETTFNPLVLGHVAGGALVMLFALWRLSIRARRGRHPRGACIAAPHDPIRLHPCLWHGINGGQQTDAPHDHHHRL